MALGVAVGFALMLGLPRPSQQKIQGKTPKQWARLLTAHPVDSQKALFSVGRALVPHLINEIQRSSNRFHGETGYAISSWLYDYAPEVLLAWVPEPIPANERCRNSRGFLAQASGGAILDEVQRDALAAEPLPPRDGEPAMSR